ncbi:MAG: hypothetical protein HYY03_02115 [Chloroflexi bacterium]|nr:hypothetical protein [Chloroflexota bacterium]
MLRGLWFAAFVSVVLLAAACSKGTGPSLSPSEEEREAEQATAAADATQESEAGGITVEATWLAETDVTKLETDVSAYNLSDYVLVRIGFTTHSGDLGEIDMEQAASLEQDGVELRPAAWLSLSDDSHHRAGVLAFPRELTQGPVEMTLIIGGEEMVFRWASEPKA